MKRFSFTQKTVDEVYHLVALAREAIGHVGQLLAHGGGAGRLPVRARQHCVVREIHRQLLQGCTRNAQIPQLQ